jgi:hypothetical protein
VPVRIGVMLAGLFGVVRGAVEMALRNMRMMAGLLVVPGFVMVGRGVMVFGRVFVVLRRVAMVIHSFFGHV